MGQNNFDAEETRQQLDQLLRQYPPSLAEVLRLDPSMLSNEAYLATYPGLAAFLAQHPEVAHNPAYFVGSQNVAELGRQHAADGSHPDVAGAGRRTWRSWRWS